MDHDELKTDPESERSEDDNAREVEDQNQREADEVRQRLERNHEAADATIEAIARISAATVQAQQLPRRGAPDIHIAIDHQGPNSPVLTERSRQRTQQTEVIPSRVRSEVLCRYLTVTCAVITATNAAMNIYFTLKAHFGGPTLRAATLHSNERVLPLAQSDDPVNSQEAKQLADTWANLSDNDYWERYATYVDLNKPRTYQEQLLFMQFTTDLGSLLMRKTWQWTSEQEKMEQVTLFSNRISDNGLANAYRSVKDTMSNGTPLPRAVAADLLSLALTDWWVNHG